MHTHIAKRYRTRGKLVETLMPNDDDLFSRRDPMELPPCLPGSKSLEDQEPAGGRAPRVRQRQGPPCRASRGPLRVASSRNTLSTSGQTRCSRRRGGTRGRRTRRRGRRGYRVYRRRSFRYRGKWCWILRRRPMQLGRASKGNRERRRSGCRRCGCLIRALLLLLLCLGGEGDT